MDGACLRDGGRWTGPQQPGRSERAPAAAPVARPGGGQDTALHLPKWINGCPGGHTTGTGQ